MKFKVCKLTDLSEGKILTTRILARRIAVLRRNDKFFAFEADCKHMKQSLGAGKVEGRIITCPAHGWKYDYTTGQCLTESWAKLKTFEIVIENDVIFVEI